MITPLPEPVDRVWAVWRGEREYLPTWSDYYTTDQLRQYGEAEYRRGIESACATNDQTDAVSKALRRAWQLGQTYWQQADSDFISQHRKSDETQRKFQALVEETSVLLGEKS